MQWTSSSPSGFADKNSSCKAIANGFDFLGYNFNTHKTYKNENEVPETNKDDEDDDGQKQKMPPRIIIRPAAKTVSNFLEKLYQLYEQDASYTRIGEYFKNWNIWVKAGIWGEALENMVVPFC